MLLNVVNMCSVNKVSLSNIEGNKTTQSFTQVIYLKISITVSTTLNVVNMCSVEVSLSNIKGNKTTQSFAQVIYLKTSITVSISPMIALAGKTDF
jgi:hypothetical protein